MAAACTIVARNYLPTARVLHASFAAAHPDVDFVVLPIDDETRDVDDARERFRVVRLLDIGLPASEMAILAAIKVERQRQFVSSSAVSNAPDLQRHVETVQSSGSVE